MDFKLKNSIWYRSEKLDEKDVDLDESPPQSQVMAGQSVDLKEDENDDIISNSQSKVRTSQEEEEIIIEDFDDWCICLII